MTTRQITLQQNITIIDNCIIEDFFLKKFYK